VQYDSGMLCPVCSKQIINPNWKLCEDRKCYYKYKMFTSRKRNAKEPNSPANRMIMSPHKLEVLALMLWQGQSKEFICEYLNITEKSLNNTLAPLNNGQFVPKGNMFVDSFYI
jgi:hypothetical protein